MLHRINSKKSQKSLAPSTSSSDSHYSQASFQWSSPTDSVLKGSQSQKLSDVDLLGDEIHNLLSEPNSPKYPEQRSENRSTLPAASTPWTSAWVHDQLSSSKDLMLEETIPEDQPIGHAGEESLVGSSSLDMFVGRDSEESQASSATKRYTVESDTLAGVVFSHPCPPPRPQRVSMFSTSNSHLSHVRNASDLSTSDHRSLSVAPPVYETLERRGMNGQILTLERRSVDTQSPTLITSGSILESMIDESPIEKITVLQPPIYETPKPEPSPRENDIESKPTTSRPKPRVASHHNPKPVWYSREENCSIGAGSTLFQLKSFCEGSLAFKNGRHQEATKTAVYVDSGAHAATSAAYHDSMTGAALALGANAPMSFGARKTVTQCIQCEYSQPAADFRRDMAKDQRANATQEGVNFRMRFLYKSHLAAETRSSTLYGCIFCSHLGYTSREGDATVFTTERQLFRHLSHHPQPLPHVPGVTVLYGYLGSNCTEAEDYDLHFPSPQFASPIIPEAPLLTKRPTALALQNQIQKEGGKPLSDPDGRRDVLQFLVGARIVGVEFPDAWGGKWCTGWHDGVRGAFPAKLVTLEAPPKSDIRLPGGNNDGVIVTARWKWEPKDTDVGWLVFDKHTVITNVSCKFPSPALLSQTVEILSND